MDNSDITPPPDGKGEDDIGDVNHDKAGGDFDWMFAKLNKHLAALKLVRRPGKGRLTVGEAVETTLAQAEAYENWCRFGAPGGVIDVWVEDKRVMALHPDGATDLHGVLFEAAGMPKAVVQVVRRADEIADTVVLLNRELRDVLHKGGRCEQQHPNNRCVTLEVRREGRGQLSFWVGFNQQGEVSTAGPGILERLRGRAAQAGTCLRAQAVRLKGACWGVPALGTAAAGLVLISCACVAFSAREQAGAPASARRPKPGAKSLVAAAVSNDAAAGSNADELLKTVGGGSAGAASGQSASVARDVKEYVPRPPTVRPRLAATHVTVVAPTDEPVSPDVEAAALMTLPGQVNAPASAADSSPWDARRLQRLAEVQRVVLKVDDATTLNKEQAEDLLASIKESLNELGIVGLTDEAEKHTADGVMLLRFEPDAALLGAIFATMRDRDGNFLWEDHAGCRVSPDGGGWAATFGDASARLLSKLLPTTGVASNQGDERPRPVFSPKSSRLYSRLTPAAPGPVIDAQGYERGRMTMSQVNYER